MTNIAAGPKNWGRSMLGGVGNFGRLESTIAVQIRIAMRNPTLKSRTWIF